MNNKTKLEYQYFEKTSADVIPYKRVVIKLDKLGRVIKQGWKEKKEVYHSIKLRDEQTFFFPFLFIDIDSKDDLEAALESVIILKTFFSKIWGKNSYRIFFSGSKGFHIYLNPIRSVSDLISAFRTDYEIRYFYGYINKELLQNKAKIDLKAVGENRIVRCVNSINFKSGLYKIFLKNEIESYSIGQILSLAKSPNWKDFDEIGVLGQCNMSDELNEDEFNKLVISIENFKKTSVSEKGINSPRQKKEKKKKLEHIQQKIDKEIYYSTKGIVDGCRAIRKLVYQVTSSESPPNGWRHYLARSLNSSDNRDEFIYSVLSCHPDFKRDVSSAQLDQLRNFSVTCDDMVAAEICSSYCDRYLTGECGSSKTPSYFGVKNYNKWFTLTSKDSVESNIRALIKYFGGTTDFFDWANLNNIQDSLEFFSLDISEKIRKGQLPDHPLTLFKVTKPNGKIRTLSMNHFETEVLLSCFIKDMVGENYRIMQTKFSENLYSFGYVQPGDDNQLITAWSDEYSHYKEKLKFFSRSQDYKFVVTDDVKDFYPSVSLKTTLDIISSFKDLDPRATQIILGYFRSIRYVDSKDGSVASSQGLPQGPIISHVIAARYLIEVDLFIQEQMDSRDYTLVRYCDDTSLFFKTENDQRYFLDVVTPKIEEKFNLIYHKDYAAGEKSFSGSIEEYFNDKLKRDLAKYDLSLQLDLAVFDKESREKLLISIKEIFGATLGLLAIDTNSNLKDFERQVSMLSWKLPNIMKNEETKSIVDDLLSVIMSMLENEKISWRLINSSLIIYLGFVKVKGVSETSEKIIECINRNINILPAIFMHLTRSIFLYNDENLRELASEIVKYGPPDKLEIQCLERFLKKIENEFDHILWGQYKELDSDFSFLPYYKKVIDALHSRSLEKFLIDQDSRFRVASEIIYKAVMRNLLSHDDDFLTYVWMIADRFRLDALSNMILFTLQKKGINLVGVTKIYGPSHVNTLTQVIVKELNVNIQEIKLEKCIESGVVFDINGIKYILEYFHLDRLSKYKVEKILVALEKTKLIVSARVIPAQENNHIYMITNLGNINTFNYVSYLNLSITESEGIDRTLNLTLLSSLKSIHSLLIPASSIYYSKSDNSITVLRPSLIMKSTLQSKYVLSNGATIGVYRKRQGLPGLRLLEAILGASKLYTYRANSQDDLLTHSFSLVSPESKTADPFWDIKKCEYLFSSVQNYRHKLASTKDHKRLVTIYKLSYEIFKMLSRRPIKYFRYEKNFKNDNFIKFFERLRELVSAFSVTKTYLTSPEASQFFSERRAHSYNYAAAINLVNGVKLDKNSPFEELNAPFKILAFSSNYFLYLSLLELDKDFGNTELRWKEISIFPDIRKARRYFIFPTLGDLEVYDDLWGKFISLELNDFSNMKFKHSPYMIKADVSIHPHDINTISEEEYSKSMAMDYLSLEAEIVYKAISADDFSAKSVFSLVKSSFSVLGQPFEFIFFRFIAQRKFNPRLSMTISSLTSLDLTSYKKLKEGQLYIGLGLGKWKTIENLKIYPDNISSFLPRRFNKYNSRFKEISQIVIIVFLVVAIIIKVII